MKSKLSACLALAWLGLGTVPAFSNGVNTFTDNSDSSASGAQLGLLGNASGTDFRRSDDDSTSTASG